MIQVDTIDIQNLFCEFTGTSNKELKKEFKFRNIQNEKAEHEGRIYFGEIEPTLTRVTSKQKFEWYKQNIQKNEWKNVIDELWERTLLEPQSIIEYNFFLNKLNKRNGKRYLSFGGCLGIEALKLSDSFETVYMSDIDKNALEFFLYVSKNLDIKNSKAIYAGEKEFLGTKTFDAITSVYTLDCFPFIEAKKMLSYLLSHCNEFYGYWISNFTEKQGNQIGIESAKKCNMKYKYEEIKTTSFCRHIWR